MIHNFWAWFQLTSANYIEHYGLLREKDDNGRYERCQPHHSWNANYIFSNIVLFHLERHSDHHAHPHRPYQGLRDLPDIPRLPSGYMGCIGMAMIPPLWFKVMDPRVMDWAGGDISKVNLDPKRAETLTRKWSVVGLEA